MPGHWSPSFIAEYKEGHPYSGLEEKKAWKEERKMNAKRKKWIKSGHEKKEKMKEGREGRRKRIEGRLIEKKTGGRKEESKYKMAVKWRRREEKKCEKGRKKGKTKDKEIRKEEKEMKRGKRREKQQEQEEKKKGEWEGKKK